MTETRKPRSVRLSEDETASVQRIAERDKVSWNEAARRALAYGAARLPGGDAPTNPDASTLLLLASEQEQYATTAEKVVEIVANDQSRQLPSYHESRGTIAYARGLATDLRARAAKQSHEGGIV